MGGVRRFSCTLCGACCNRSPEVELSEAAALGDVFVFRLMFRLISLPRHAERGQIGSSELFYQKKRLLAGHAAARYSTKVMRGGKAVETVQYLMISALAMDMSPGACTALKSGRCSIHAKRPLSCRTVPFHYSRAEGLALADFDSFVSTPGYRCDTGKDAALFFNDGRIVNEEVCHARTSAAELARRDRPWKEAIVRHMRSRGAGNDLPSLQELRANAAVAAMTTSMRAGWQIAAALKLMTQEQELALVRLQLETIRRELANFSGSLSDAQTLREMAAEYRHALDL